MNNINQIPDDSYYNTEPNECDGKDWKNCPCEECQGRREDYADILYERRRDKEMEL